MCFSCSTEAGQQAHEFFEIIGYWSFKIDNDLDPKNVDIENDFFIRLIPI